MGAVCHPDSRPCHPGDRLVTYVVTRWQAGVALRHVHRQAMAGRLECTESTKNDGIRFLSPKPAGASHTCIREHARRACAHVRAYSLVTWVTEVTFDRIPPTYLLF